MVEVEFPSLKKHAVLKKKQNKNFKQKKASRQNQESRIWRKRSSLTGFKKDFQPEKTGPSQESRVWRKSSYLKGLSKGFLKRIFNKKKDGTKPRIQDLEEKIIFERFFKRIFNKKKRAQAKNPGFGGKVHI